MHGQGASNINYSTVVFDFNVCRLSCLSSRLLHVCRETLQLHVCLFACTVRACLHEGGGPQIGEVTCGRSPHLSCKRDQMKMRDYVDRRVTHQRGLPHLPGVPHLHVNRPCLLTILIHKQGKRLWELMKWSSTKSFNLFWINFVDSPETNVPLIQAFNWSKNNFGES